MRWIGFNMRRATVGIIALVLVGIAGYGFARHGFDDGTASFFWNSCWRIGLVLGAVWLALPNLLERGSGASPLVLTLAVAIGLVIVVRPRAIIFLWPVLLILGVVQFGRWLANPPRTKTAQNKR